MKRVLIAGAAGYVGRWASEELIHRGYEVHGITRNAPIALPGMTSHPADLHSEDAIKIVREVRASHLLLTAWTTEHGEYWNSEENERWVHSSFNLAHAFLHAGGERVVLAGTCAEYDWSDHAALGSPVKETAVTFPQTRYGRAKLEIAVQLAKAATTFRASFANGRIFFPIGIGEDARRFLPTVINSLLRDETAKLGNPELVRDLIDVRDCGAALGALVDTKAAGAVNIGSGKGVTLRELAELAAAKLGKRDLIAFNVFPPRPDDPPMLVGDVSRLYQEAGFSPRYALDQTIDSAIEYWRMQVA